MTIRLNLIGLFRSGTNYARTILEWNYDVEVVYDAYGWKHAMVPTFTDFSKLTYPDGKLLVVVKDPYSTLLSWYNYATKNGRNVRGDTRSFSTFIRNKIYFRDDNNKSLAPEYYFTDPVQMWNSVVWNHLSVASQTGGFVVEYGELLLSPEETSSKIASYLGLKRKSAEFLCPKNILRNMNDGINTDEKSRYLTRKVFHSSYQLNREYIHEYSEDDWAFVTRSLDADVIRDSKIRLDGYSDDASDMSPVLFTVSGDARLLACACFMESNRGLDELPVHLIPFDDDILMTKQLADIYGARFITPDPKWDRLGKAIFREEEYRPGIPSWKYFRKLNVFDGTPRKVIYADSNVVFLNGPQHALDVLKTHDLVFGGRSKQGRNFSPWAGQLLNILDPNLRDGFNASFWVTRSDLFSDLDIELLQRPKLRVMLGKAPEQSFMQLAAVLLRKRLGALGEINESIRPTLWGDVSPIREISHALEHKMTLNGKIPLAIKWSGRAFHKKEAIRSANVYEPLFVRVLDRVGHCPKLTKALNVQYKIAVQD